jgi:DNA-binding protein
MYVPVTKTIDVGKKPLDEYVFEAIVSFREGINELVIKGRGLSISKAVDLYWRLKDRLGESIELVDVKIGSERFKGRMKSYIEIHVRRKD